MVEPGKNNKIKDLNTIYANVSKLTSKTIIDKDVLNINNLYNYIKYKFVPTPNFKGIPGEAFKDEAFAKLMTEAVKYIDRPYVWGGSSPETSFDCSGYVCWVFTSSDTYDLTRTTAQGIYDKCKPVSKEELEPGDLVFFTETYKANEKVTHVGIYAGDGQMIHAGDPIGYDDLSDSYWQEHFYSFGRLGN